VNKKILYYVYIIISSICLTMILKIVVVSSYIIPSESMTPTLIPGDYILVNKLCLGARISSTFYFMENRISRRSKGYSKLKRNDVVVYNYQYPNTNCEKIILNYSKIFIKRCIGIAGDTISILDGYYKINGIKGYGNLIAQKKLCENKIKYLNQINASSASKNYSRIYTNNIANNGLNPNLLSLREYRKTTNWNIINFGPLIIPQKGQEVQVDMKNIFLYKKLIEFETGKSLSINKKSIYLDNYELKKYVFNSNWYFMAGDRVLNSKDSRYYGLVPEGNLIGKASIVLYSRNIENKKYTWKRFFKKIN